MDSLNQLEIQNIRHICGNCTNFCDKITYYKTLTQDQNITEILTNVFTECKQLKTELSNML